MLLNFGRHDVPPIFGIDRKSPVKLLGILFDEMLSFNDHVKCITKRATAKLYVVFRLKRIGFSIRELTLLYKALVLPTLTYCCSVWGGTSDENLRKIDRVQSRVVRLGIINEYTPIKNIIRISDKKLHTYTSLNKGRIMSSTKYCKKSHRNVRITRKKTTS